jgi:hypothetical protein
MYRKIEPPSTPPEKFELPFDGKLSEDNRLMLVNKKISKRERDDS